MPSGKVILMGLLSKFAFSASFLSLIFWNSCPQDATKHAADMSYTLSDRSAFAARTPASAAARLRVGILCRHRAVHATPRDTYLAHMAKKDKLAQATGATVYYRKALGLVGRLAAGLQILPFRHSWYQALGLHRHLLVSEKKIQSFPRRARARLAHSTP